MRKQAYDPSQINTIDIGLQMNTIAERNTIQLTLEDTSVANRRVAKN